MERDLKAVAVMTSPDAGERIREPFGGKQGRKEELGDFQPQNAA